MTFMKRAALGVAALSAAALAATVPAQPAMAYEYCLSEGGPDQPAICLGSSECDKVGSQLRKFGIEAYCLQSRSAATATAAESCIQVYLVKPGCLTDLPPIE